MRHDTFKKAKKPEQMIVVLYRLAYNRHCEFSHVLVSEERRCAECQFLKRVKKAFKIDDKMTLEDAFEDLHERMEGLFNRNITRCQQHPTYEGIARPRAACTPCIRVWKQAERERQYARGQNR